ncbi:MULTISPECIES: amidohydrolase family protein [Moorena]|uniref:BarH n=2 Tax=Cyanophyceae TaxID=3028117 RepID=F4XJI0_9CYAN|nr:MULTISPECIES: amidohydrolase family protein [Moorena]AAN32982.1 BarH [Lyngbya majuscula]AEE88296.1 BarH [Moorena producens 3L]EGJ35260.1 putative metal-dependent hydrolase, TIM-barrel family [Moorena producens 3L]NEP37086.1 amidohydrolase [Moorena sp. SIO3B2]NEP69472.1 amidohydrolase [Moorena sp. SIO3A5]
MLKNFDIIDADSHVLEPDDLWEKYLDPQFKDLAPKDNQFEGKSIMYKTPDVVVAEGRRLFEENPDRYKGGYNPQARVELMEKMGSDVTFLYPTIGLFMWAIDTMDSKLADALVRAYNNWLQDFCSHDPQKLRGVGAISQHDPEDMVPELQRIAEFGWRAVFIRPNPVKGKLLSDPAYEPFWSECERLNIAVTIHEGTHSRLPTAGADRFHSRFALHTCSHPLEMMMGLLAMIEGGVLERHPQLRVGLFEAGCGWLPYWLWRMDEKYENLVYEVKDNVKMKPSEYFHRQCFIGVETSEPYIPELIQYIGADKLLFGSDFPHMDHPNFIESVDEALALKERLPEETIHKILHDNPLNYYGLT